MMFKFQLAQHPMCRLRPGHSRIRVGVLGAAPRQPPAGEARGWHVGPVRARPAKAGLCPCVGLRIRFGCLIRKHAEPCRGAQGDRDGRDGHVPPRPCVSPGQQPGERCFPARDAGRGQDPHPSAVARAGFNDCRRGRASTQARSRPSRTLTGLRVYLSRPPREPRREPHC